MKKDSVQEIKDKLDIIDVVQEYVQLKKSGANLKACCPFHNEKTPSFMVNQDKQIWHCFGCNLGGDMFTFIQKIENLDFIGSLRFLARKAGVHLQNYDSKASSKKNSAVQALDLSHKFYSYCLKKLKDASIAKDYLTARNVSQESIEKFSIGYSPKGWSSLLDFLKKKKFKTEDIENAGLIIARKSGNGHFDRFRNRLMFPIHNHNGDVLGFGARILDEEEKGAKYINSPQSLVYNKSEVIYGLYYAKDAIRKEDFAIVVEGYLDVIANHQVGIENVVASSGIAFSEKQLKLLTRFSKTLYFCFDNDDAGQQALMQAVERALGFDVSIKVITIPKEFGKDPDDCINNSIANWKQCIEDAQDFFDYLLDNHVLSKKKNSFEDQLEGIQVFLRYVSYIQNSLRQDHLLNNLARLSGHDIITLKGEFKKVQKERKSGTYQASHPAPVNRQDTQKIRYSIEFKYLAFLLFVPSVWEKNFKDNEIIETLFFNPQFLFLYKYLNVYYNNKNILSFLKDGTFDYEQFLNSIIKDSDVSLEKQTKIRDIGNSLFLFFQKEYSHIPAGQITHYFDKLQKLFLKQQIQKELAHVSSQMEMEVNPEKIQELSKRFTILISYFK